MSNKKVKRAFKFRFYPTPEQEKELLQTWGCVRLVYNKALDMRHTAWYKHQKRVNYAQTSAALTQWKKQEEFSFLKEVSSIPLQQCLRHLQTAYTRFFKKKSRYPKFKSRKNLGWVLHTQNPVLSSKKTSSTLLVSTHHLTLCGHEILIETVFLL